MAVPWGITVSVCRFYLINHLYADQHFRLIDADARRQLLHFDKSHPYMFGFLKIQLPYTLPTVELIYFYCCRIFLIKNKEENENIDLNTS